MDEYIQGPHTRALLDASRRAFAQMAKPSTTQPPVTSGTCPVCGSKAKVIEYDGLVVGEDHSCTACGWVWSSGLV